MLILSRRFLQFLKPFLVYVLRQVPRMYIKGCTCFYEIRYKCEVYIKSLSVLT